MDQVISMCIGVTPLSSTAKFSILGEPVTSLTMAEDMAGLLGVFGSSPVLCQAPALRDHTDALCLAFTSSKSLVHSLWISQSPQDTGRLSCGKGHFYFACALWVSLFVCFWPKESLFISSEEGFVLRLPGPLPCSPSPNASELTGSCRVTLIHDQV